MSTGNPCAAGRTYCAGALNLAVNRLILQMFFSKHLSIFLLREDGSKRQADLGSDNFVKIFSCHSVWFFFDKNRNWAIVRFCWERWTQCPFFEKIEGRWHSSGFSGGKTLKGKHDALSF